MSEITPISKTKADDYLKELSNQNKGGWLSPLVDHIIAKRSMPDDSFLKTTYENFLTEHKLTNAEEVTTEIEPSIIQSTRSIPITKVFKLKNLTHKSGVNALLTGASISFHPNLTVVYGKNGSGKSGFVRILKKISASRTKEDIWQNINNSRKKNECDVKITFNDGTDRSLSWNGQENISPFNQMSIFDGKCIPIYLTKGLDFSYQPYGFELFQLSSDSLINLQQQLSESIQEAEEDRSPLEDVFNGQTTIGKFVNGITPLTKVEELDNLPRWDQKAQQALTANLKKSKGLQSLDQQFEILQTRLQKVTTLQEKLEEIQTETSASSIRTYLQLIKKFNVGKKKFAAQKGKTLEDYEIQEMESDEWEKFIEAGEEYTDIACHENYPEDDDNCIYCQQKLSKTAIKLIKLYRELYQEEESNNFEDIENELDEALSNLEDVSFSDDFPYERSNFTKVLTDKIASSAFNAMDRADALVKQVVSQLKAKKITKLQPLNISSLISNVGKAKAKILKEIKELQETQKNFSRRSKELDQSANELRDIQKFAKHKKQVEKYIRIEQWIAKAKSVSARLNTKSITDLGKKAWKELVSDSFKRQFNTEVASLSAPTVNLDFRGEYGSQMREKSLGGLSQIDQFLSEGEQKAVALADFFAELSMQNGKMPVIFDDPATSFDHDRKEKIAKRIVKESESRQVVVFTHDLMFANYLHEQVEQNNNDLDNSKAAFHNVERNISDAGLVSENDYAGSVKFNAQIQKVEEMVTPLSGLNGEVKRDGIRNAYGKLRKAVEKAVEEKIFGKVVTRWSDQIKLHNAPNATLSKPNLEKAKELHEQFSRYIDAHDQSNEMMQHAMPNDLEKLKTDIKQVKDLAL
jgi:ABC-type lipoprotein export system ATPase subunit